MKNQSGLTLVELIVTIVVLGVGLTGVLSVMMTVIRHSVEPALQWQAVNIGNNALQTLLHETPQKLAMLQNIKDQKIQATFPQSALSWGDTTQFTISIDVQPYREKGIFFDQINVKVFHPALGYVNFTGLKAADNHENEQEPRIYTY